MEDKKALAAMDEITPFSGEEFVNTEAQSLPMPSMPMMQAKTQFITAIKVQEPRRIAKVTKNVLAEAKLAKKSFYYAWPVKTKDGKMKRIEGPSIDLAMCLARNYGNAALDIEVSETPTHYIFKGYFIDLETGFTVPRLYRQRKSQTIGKKYDKDRQEDIVFQIGHSKAQRNAIIKAMPNWLIEQAIEVAKQAEIADIQTNPHLARARVLEFFEEYGIDTERIEVFFGKKVDQLTTKDIETLRATARALKEGQVSPEEVFVVDEEEDKLKEMDKKLKEKLKETPPPSPPEPEPQTEKPKEPVQQAEPPNILPTEEPEALKEAATKPIELPQEAEKEEPPFMENQEEKTEVSKEDQVFQDIMKRRPGKSEEAKKKFKESVLMAAPDLIKLDDDKFKKITKKLRKSGFDEIADRLIEMRTIPQGLQEPSEGPKEIPPVADEDKAIYEQYKAKMAEIKESFIAVDGNANRYYEVLNRHGLREAEEATSRALMQLALVDAMRELTGNEQANNNV